MGSSGAIQFIMEVEPRPDYHESDDWDARYHETAMAIYTKDEVIRRDTLGGRPIATRDFFQSKRHVNVSTYENSDQITRYIGPMFSKSSGVSDEAWQAFAEMLDVFNSVATVTRITMLGESISDTAGRLVASFAERWGYAQPGVVRSFQPPWVNVLTHTGEAVACLSLTANTAANLDANDTRGREISYTVRADLGSGLVPITSPFEFRVENVFENPLRPRAYGRAIAVRPLHDETALYVAFRGVQVDDALGRQADCKTLLLKKMVDADWLPAGRVHAGTLNYHKHLWAAGLYAKLQSHAERRSPGRVLFVGISLGGALAQLSALHAAIEFPALASKIHVLAFGATTWATRQLSDRFASTFGSRAVNLLTTHGLDGADACLAEAWKKSGWHLKTTGETSEEEASLLLDPVACGFSDELVQTHNLLAFPVPTTAAEQRAAVDGSSSSEVVEPSAGSSGAAEGARVRGDEFPRQLTLVAPGKAQPADCLQMLSAGVAARGEADEVADEVADEAAGAAALSRASDMDAFAAARLRATPLVIGAEAAAVRSALTKQQPHVPAHEFDSYWNGEMQASHPFASDVGRLHNGRSYRAMLVAEHLKMSAFARDSATRAGRPDEFLGDGSALPFVLQSDEICWDCLCGLAHTVDTSPESRCWQAEQALEDPEAQAAIATLLGKGVAQEVEEEPPRITDGLTFEELKAIQLDAMADDVPIVPERMCRWTEDEARAYFESGGEEEPQVP